MLVCIYVLYVLIVTVDRYFNRCRAYEKDEW